jgi:putative membrane protein
MIDWRHWHNEPYLVGGLIALGWLYALLCGPFRNRIHPEIGFPRRKAWAFFGSLLIFYLAVGSPLDQAGERFLLSAHMVQHQLLIYPAAILFLVGIPDWLLAPVTRRPHVRRSPGRPLPSHHLFRGLRCSLDGLAHAGPVRPGTQGEDHPCI